MEIEKRDAVLSRREWENTAQAANERKRQHWIYDEFCPTLLDAHTLLKEWDLWYINAFTATIPFDMVGNKEDVEVLAAIGVGGIKSRINLRIQIASRCKAHWLTLPVADSSEQSMSILS